MALPKVKSRVADVLSQLGEGTLNSGGELHIPPANPHFVRMVVLDVVSNSNEDTLSEDTKTKWQGLQVSNMKYANVLPRNTIIAKKASSDTSPMFVFPFFPSHLSLPCKPGEMVWVMIEKPEAKDIDIAYWFGRVVEPHTSDDVNHSHPGRSLESSMFPDTKDRHDNEKGGSADSGENVWHELRNAPVRNVGNSRFTAGEGTLLRGADEDVFERLITDTSAAALMSYESVPRFNKRPGDVAIEGTNNTLIVLGTDRSGPLQTGEDVTGVGVGAIDIVAGRGQIEDTYGVEAKTTSIRDANGKKKGTELKKELNKSPDVLKSTEGDPDMLNDRSRVLVSQRTMVDSKFGLSSYSSGVGVSDSAEGDAAIVIKSDKVRLIARSDVQILVTGFSEDIKKAPNGQLRKDENSSTDKWGSITIKSNGDVVISPSEKGYIKLGSDAADKAILCTDLPAKAIDGKVSAPPISDTAAGFIGTSASGQGTWAKKVLVD
jgi:hypothetical protein